MRKFASVGILIFGMCWAAAAADDVPTLEVFGGASWLHADSMKIAGIKQNYAGWDAEGQYNFNKLLGVTADISGHYGRLQPNIPNSHSYTFVFGPTFSYRAEHSTIFAHALFGGNDTKVVLAAGPGNSASDTAFAMALGGGLDIKINQRFAIRLGQLDWLYTHHDLSKVRVDGLVLRDHQSNIRYAGGVVINFGQH